MRILAGIRLVFAVDIGAPIIVDIEGSVAEIGIGLDGSADDAGLLCGAPIGVAYVVGNTAVAENLLSAFICVFVGCYDCFDIVGNAVALSSEFGISYYRNVMLIEEIRLKLYFALLIEEVFLKELG